MERLKNNWMLSDPIELRSKYTGRSFAKPEVGDSRLRKLLSDHKDGFITTAELQIELNKIKSESE